MGVVITGIHGQDASYLAESLLARQQAVIGVARCDHVKPPPAAIRALQTAHPDRFSIAQLDLNNPAEVDRFVATHEPAAIYHLAARSQAGRSFHEPAAFLADNVLTTLHLLESLRHHAPACRFLAVSSFEIFGHQPGGTVRHDAPHHPATPYGVSKSAAFHLARIYRDAHHLHIAQVIPSNHESPRRSTAFVTMKLAAAAARAASDPEAPPVAIGNLDSARDWGWAPEYTDAFRLALDHPMPGDHLIATGCVTPLRAFAAAAFTAAGFRPIFVGSGLGESAIDSSSGRLLLTVSPEFFRPTDPAPPTADTTPTTQTLGWSATTVGTGVATRLVQSLLASC